MRGFRTTLLAFGLLSAFALSFAQAVEVTGTLADADRDFQQAMAQWRTAPSATVEALLQHALTIRLAILGPESVDVAAVIERLGALNYNNGRYPQAEALFRHALAIDHQTLGDHRFATAYAMGDVGAALRQQGRYCEAQPLVEESVAIRREIVPNTPSLAGGLDNLALIYAGEHEYDKARKASEEALHILQALVPPDESHVAWEKTFLQHLGEAAAQYGGRRHPDDPAGACGVS